MFLAGSRTSGGFSIGRPQRLARSDIPLESRALCRGRVGEAGSIELPVPTGCLPGERLLVVRGSGLALGFIRQGPIFQEALRHPELDTFPAEHQRSVRSTDKAASGTRRDRRRVEY